MTTAGVKYTLPDGTRRTIEADTVIPTAPVEPDLSLAAALEGAVAEVYAIGDCSKSGMIVDAVAAGRGAAAQI